MNQKQTGTTSLQSIQKIENALHFRLTLVRTADVVAHPHPHIYCVHLRSGTSEQPFIDCFPHFFIFFFLAFIGRSALLRTSESVTQQTLHRCNFWTAILCLVLLLGANRSCFADSLFEVCSFLNFLRHIRFQRAHTIPSPVPRGCGSTTCVTQPSCPDASMRPAMEVKLVQKKKRLQTPSHSTLPPSLDRTHCPS